MLYAARIFIKQIQINISVPVDFFEFMLLKYFNVMEMFTTTLWGWSTKMRLSQNVRNKYIAFCFQTLHLGPNIAHTSSVPSLVLRHWCTNIDQWSSLLKTSIANLLYFTSWFSLKWTCALCIKLKPLPLANEFVRCQTYLHGVGTYTYTLFFKNIANQ